VSSVLQTIEELRSLRMKLVETVRESKRLVRSPGLRSMHAVRSRPEPSPISYSNFMGSTHRCTGCGSILPGKDFKLGDADIERQCTAIYCPRCAKYLSSVPWPTQAEYWNALGGP
jgi:hypothetical protein